MMTETLGMAEGNGRFGVRASEERPPQFFFAAAVLGGEQEERMAIQLRGQGPTLLLQLSALKLVTFGRHYQERALVIGQEITEGLFLFLRPPANIDDDDDRAQLAGMDEVVLYQLLPLSALLFGNLGISVAGQIDEGEAVVDHEEIELPGPSGGGTGAGNRTVEQPVGERRFPDVRAAGEGDFRVWQFGVPPGLRRRAGEFDRSDFHGGALPDARLLLGLTGFLGSCKCGAALFFLLLWQ